ncbi:MAG: hypothetical protein COB04_00770 [Gammaproteobacteria bacterium]|nr:MAG: hypothetical protein COB04_00770 [Gammaproteobacteria bacterium]
MTSNIVEIGVASDSSVLKKKEKKVKKLKGALDRAMKDTFAQAKKRETAKKRKKGPRKKKR